VLGHDSGQLFPGHAGGVILANTTGGRADDRLSIEIFGRLGGADSAAARVTSPVLILAGEDDPVCPLPVVRELASRLPADTTRLVSLPGARHAIFRDRPDLAFPAIERFIRQIAANEG
jgi:pimeloyl-ACP methyl ester carboxylesterase